MMGRGGRETTAGRARWMAGVDKIKPIRAARETDFERFVSMMRRPDGRR